MFLYLNILYIYKSNYYLKVKNGMTKKDKDIITAIRLNRQSRKN